MRHVIFPKAPAGQRWALRHTPTSDSKQHISSCFQAKKIEFSEIVVVNGTKMSGGYLFLSAQAPKIFLRLMDSQAEDAAVFVGSEVSVA